MISPKSTITVLCFAVSAILTAQVYDGVSHIDKKSPDEDNVIFKPGKNFIYVVSPDTFFQEQTPKLLEVTPVSFPKSKRTNKQQTEVIYSFAANDNKVSGNTGVIENKDNLWLHPPRSDVFEALELCPFPYVKFPLEEGLTWNDLLMVGDQWADERWGTWQGKLKVELQYEVIDYIENEDGSSYWVIEGEANSAIGQTSLMMLFNIEHGFLKMAYEINDEELVLDLKEVKPYPVLESMEEYLQYKMKQ